MSNVFLHTRDFAEDQWTNASKQFLQLPKVGEYIMTRSNGDLYEVRFVQHCAFDNPYAAEIYAVKVNRLAAMSDAIGK